MAKKPTYEELERKVQELEKQGEKFKIAEDSLRQSEERFRSIVESTTDCILVWDREYNYIYANQAAIDHVGTTRDKVIGKNIYDGLGHIPEFMDLWKGRIDEIFATGRTMRVEDKIPVGDKVIFRESVVSPILDADGRMFAVSVVYRDVTDRRQAEQALKTSQERLTHLAQIINFLPDATFAIDTEGKVIAWNQAIENMTGKKAQEMLGKGDYEYAIPFYGERRPVLIDIVGKWEKEIEKKYQYVRKEGESLISETYDPLVKPGGFLWNKASLLYDHNGEVIGAIESIRDITDRKVAEEALRESEEQYRTLMDNLPVAVYRNTPGSEGEFLMANPAFCKMFGFKDEEEVKKVAVADLYANPKERQQYSDNLIQKGLIENDERTLVKRDGTPVHTSITARVVYDDGEVSHFDSIMLDITDRKLAETALWESEEKYRSVLESIEEGYYETDLAGNFTFFNASLSRIFGYSENQIMGMNYIEKIDKEAADRLYRIFNKVYKTGKPVKGFEYEVSWKDGSKNFVEISVSLLRDAGGKPIGFRGIIRDVAERKLAEEENKRLEAQLQQAQKMEAIATLAGGIAHEFNNALMGILGNIELLKMDLPEDERRDKYFAAMRSSSHRMSRLTAQLLAYARGGKYQPKDLKLDDFVIQTLPILQHDINSAIRVETHFSKDIPHIKADYTQMQMVLSAIVANSNEAIEDEGFIRITAENKDLDEAFTKHHPGLKPGPYVCLIVEDNGKGMDEETTSRIFEPFFTTKFHGRGMGMPAVYGIVKNHDGWISVDSELGQGTAVKIYLPAISAGSREGAKAVTQPEVDLGIGEGTILVIEDEEVVIEVTQTMLERLGYRVMVARTGKAAIHIAETFDGQIDLALLDIKLPDMEGGKVYPLIMKARPDLKVIVFSGFAIEGPARGILDAGAQDFIQKPFSLATLSEKVREVLEGSVGVGDCPFPVKKAHLQPG